MITLAKRKKSVNRISRAVIGKVASEVSLPARARARATVMFPVAVTSSNCRLKNFTNDLSKQAMNPRKLVSSKKTPIRFKTGLVWSS